MRVRYPYARQVLVQLWRAARAEHADPVDTGVHRRGPDQGAGILQVAARQGGLVRINWEMAELAAAAHVYTIKRYGPDPAGRLLGHSAMSQVSYGAGVRFYSLIGGVVLSFRPGTPTLMASPQVFGDQTDVPSRETGTTPAT